MGLNERLGRDTKQYEDEVEAMFRRVLDRAWIVGLERAQVAAMLERVLREKHFQARVME